MGMYDGDTDCVRADERYIARCHGCGRERLKKRMVTLLARTGYSNPKTIGHFCTGCFAALCDKYEMEGGYGNG